MKETLNATPTEEAVLPPLPGLPPLSWLKPEQVAELLQVSLRFVQKMIEKGELPATTLGSGKIKRVYYNDLMIYMAEHRTPVHADTH